MDEMDRKWLTQVRENAQVAKRVRSWSGLLNAVWLLSDHEIPGLIGMIERLDKELTELRAISPGKQNVGEG